MADPRVAFVCYLLAWAVATIFVLVTVGQFSLQQFYVVSLIGFFIVAEITATETLRVSWQRRVRIVGGLLGVGFVLIVVFQIHQIVTIGT